MPDSSSILDNSRVRTAVLAAGARFVSLDFLLSSILSYIFLWGGGVVSGGAMVLGKLPVPGRPTYLANSRARAYCACSGCGWGLLGHFYSRPSFLSSSLGDGPI